MLKRFLCLALLMLLAFCLPATAEDEALRYVDTWIENTGYGTLIINADGTSVMTYYDDTVTECHWEVTEDGARFTDGQWLNSPMELLDENTLSVSNGWSVFTREGFEPSWIELNAVPVGEEGLPFFGTWVLDSFTYEDAVYSAAEYFMNMTLIFNEDGIVFIEEDGTTRAAAWSVADECAVVDGDILSINEADQLVMGDEENQFIFLRSEEDPEAADPMEEEELSDEEQLLALLELLSQMDFESDVSSLPEELQGFVGEWYMVYTATGGLTGDLRTMGVNCTLILNADGTGSIDFPSYEEAAWYDDEGIVRFGEAGMPMTLLEGGFLQYGTVMGGCMIFSQDSLAEFDPAVLAPTPVVTEAPAAPAASDIVFTTHEDYLDKRFVATTCTMAGQTYESTLLGLEYSLLFRSDGTCDFTMAGTPLAGLSWGLDQVSVGLTKVDAFSINYYGMAFNAVPTPTGFDMDYYGTMTLHFTLAE